MPDTVESLLRIRELTQVEINGMICYGETATSIYNGVIREPVLFSKIYDVNGNLIEENVPRLPYFEVSEDMNRYPILGGEGSDGEYIPIS